jgi:hypothetical protein
LENVYLGASRNADGSVNAPSVTDPEELALAKAGRDWSCAHCGSNNPGNQSHCRNCGAEHIASKNTSKGKSGRQSWTSAPQNAHASAEESEDYLSFLDTQRKQGLRWGAGIIGGLLVLAAIGWWGNQTHDVPGEVSHMTWAHHTHKQHWSQVSSGGWAPVYSRAEIPPVNGAGEQAGIAITGCYQKHHHYEQYQCGTETETYTEQVACGSTQSCSVVDNGNGSFTESCSNVTQYCSETRTRQVPKYCQESIEQEWCDYRTQRWVEVNRATLSGSDKTGMQWPPLAVGSLDRLTHSQEYEVTLSYDDGDGPETHLLELTQTAEYKSWSLGDPVILSVRNFGTIANVRRAEPEVTEPATSGADSEAPGETTVPAPSP